MMVLRARTTLVSTLLICCCMPIGTGQELATTTFTPDDGEEGQTSTLPPDTDTTTEDPSDPSNVDVLINQNGLNLRLTFSGKGTSIEMTSDMSVLPDSEAERIICGDGSSGSNVGVYLMKPTSSCDSISQTDTVAAAKITDFNKLHGYGVERLNSIHIADIQTHDCFFVLAEKSAEAATGPLPTGDILDIDSNLDTTTLTPRQLSNLENAVHVAASELLELQESESEGDLENVDDSRSVSDAEVIKKNKCLSRDKQSYRFLSLPFLSVPDRRHTRLFAPLNLANFNIIATGSAFVFVFSPGGSSSSSGFVVPASGDTYQFNPFSTFPQIQLVGPALTAVYAVSIAILIGYVIVFFIFVAPGIGTGISRMLDSGPARRVSNIMTDIADRSMDGLTNAVFSGIEKVSGVNLKRRYKRRKTNLQRKSRHQIPYTADVGYYYNYFSK